MQTSIFIVIEVLFAAIISILYIKYLQKYNGLKFIFLLLFLIIIVYYIYDISNRFHRVLNNKYNLKIDFGHADILNVIAFLFFEIIIIIIGIINIIKKYSK